jgi:hypothetical protein
MSSSVAAAIVARQNKAIRRFKEAGAVSPETAVELDQIGLRDSRVFRRMVDRDVFKTTVQGKYYMDVDAAEEYRKRRRERALTALLIVLAIAAVVIYLSTIR